MLTASVRASDLNSRSTPLPKLLHPDVGGDEVGGTEQTHETVCGVRELTSLDQGLNEEGSRGALVAAWVGEVLHLAEKICAEEAWDVGPGGGQGGLSLPEGV